MPPAVKTLSIPAPPETVARRLRPLSVLATLALALAAVAIVAMRTGAFPISSGELLLSIAARVHLASRDAVPPPVDAVLWSIRLPRVLLGIAAGAGLGAAGAALQGVFRNPLADPMLIGVSSGAALAVTAVIVFASAAGVLVLPFAGFAGGLAATLLLYRLATHDGRTSLATMLLAGIALNALAFAGIGLLTTVASNDALRNIAFWNFGSLAGAPLELAGVVAVAVVLACVALARMAPGLNALLLGDLEARHLGYDTHRLKRTAIALAALLAGFVVAACGVIGFVALVAPHVVRLACGPDHRIVVPGAALAGALLLLSADLVARLVVAPAEIPIGIVTALVGAPFFLALLVRRRDKLA